MTPIPFFLAKTVYKQQNIFSLYGEQIEEGLARAVRILDEDPDIA
jgi:hypothetical protein